jgi:hypothetical protein
VAGGNFPVNGNQPEEAIRLLLRCIQALPGIVVGQWTSAHFLEHVRHVDLIARSTLSLSDSNVVHRRDAEMFVRVHYEENEQVLCNLLAFFASSMTAANSSMISLRPRGYGDLIAQLSFNFAPNEANITSEAQLRSVMPAHSHDPTPTPPSAGILNSALGTVSGLVGAGSSLTAKTLGIGTVIKKGLGMIAPLLQAKGISVPGVSGSSPSNAADLVDVLHKYEPAMNVLKALTTSKA